MSRIEELLRQLRPREPSANYLEAGIARIASPVPRHGIRQEWRYATIGLAGLLTVSVILNVALWRGQTDVQGKIDAVEKQSLERYLAYSVLRPEGDLLVRETRYEFIEEDAAND